MAIDTRLARRNYVALTITLTQNTVQNLLTLINAALASHNAECPGAAREVSIQSTAGNTVSVYIGDSLVSATNAGYELVAGAAGSVGASRLYRGSVSCVPVGELHTFSTGVSQKLNVEVTVL